MVASHGLLSMTKAILIVHLRSAVAKVISSLPYYLIVSNRFFRQSKDKYENVDSTNFQSFLLKKVKTKHSETGSRYYGKQGFTLIELITTLAVLAIIATIAAPSILSYLANMEAKRIKHDMINTLTVAKAESYIQRQNLLVCLSDAGGRCDKNAKEALLSFVDNNDDKHFDVGIDELINELRLNPKYGTLHLRAGGRDYIRFYGDTGQPRGHFGHIKYCPSSTYSQSMYQISFSQIGIIKYKPNSIHSTGC